MSMSPAFHLLGKAMQGESLNENQIKTIIGVIRKEERMRIIKLLRSVTDNTDWIEMPMKDIESLIKGEQK